MLPRTLRRSTQSFISARDCLGPAATAAAAVDHNVAAHAGVPAHADHEDRLDDHRDDDNHDDDHDDQGDHDRAALIVSFSLALSMSPSMGRARRHRPPRQGTHRTLDDSAIREFFISERDTFCDTLVCPDSQTYKDLDSHRGLVSI